MDISVNVFTSWMGSVRDIQKGGFLKQYHLFRLSDVHKLFQVASDQVCIWDKRVNDRRPSLVQGFLPDTEE